MKTIVITLASIPNTKPWIPTQLTAAPVTTAAHKCDYNEYYCLLKTRPPDQCTFGLGSNSKQCHCAVHHKCQMSWERYANIDEEDKCEQIFCRDHHPAYQTWFKKHRKTVQEQKSNTRDALFVETQKNPGWSRNLVPPIRLIKESQFSQLEQVKQKQQRQINSKNRRNPQQNLCPVGLGRPQKQESLWLRMSKSFTRKLG